ncbi:hypothetical protein CYMTET_33100 [Cymbomonas tetramitiformis]|uniref:AAA+ ATPase domain-containing protein n=1 Tax=Cymbomonas tetramitiformis TaxID=36881 RepID=A0AAE0KRJ6_9CHLO|nr:hypothetical protein CYMTET_33100 [Cymbomonas tetramitiformis]
MILEPDLGERMMQISASTAPTKRRGAPFRNVLLWGQPGTGKTMAAERLASRVGLDFAMMSGGDVLPLGKSAVTELHQLFNWAERSASGVLLFIDEAEAFLRNRNSSQMTEQMRSTLNAFLARTGTQSSKLMLVLASNRQDDLDDAVLDRLDELVEFQLPGPQQRKQIIRMYLDKYLPDAKTKTWKDWRRRHQFVRRASDLSDDALDTAVQLTQGCSGRELAKFITAVQAQVFGREGEIIVTAQDLRHVAERKRQEHHQKVHNWGAEKETARSVVSGKRSRAATLTG